MAGPANPFSALHQKDGVAGSAGRGRGGAVGRSTPFQARNTNTGAPRDPKFRGRGRGASATARAGRGNARGASALGSTRRNNTSETRQTAPGSTASPFSQLKQNRPSPSPGAAGISQQKSSFSGFGKASPQPFGAPSFDGTVVDASRDPRQRPFSRPTNGAAGPGVPVEDASIQSSYPDRYEKLKLDRAKQREQAIKDGQMADPNQPTSLNKAITPVGTCTSMCPEFERVERIVQKMVDKSEKFLHPATNLLQTMEGKMLKRFRRSAAGYDEQLPSDIRTPRTLLQTMNYLIRHVLGGSEPLGLIHKFVWDRTRSIRNDFSVQQLTQEEDVRIAVTCLERIARFHIASLHLLSSPENEEPFDRHQEREQLNNTMLSLMYYYDDNRGRISFPNEDEFRAYYIIFSIHDQRPDLEARVQKWPPELRNSPRVRVALELFAAAGNTWEYQGTLDAKRPNAIAQGFYARFFGLVDSPGVSYLMACVAEIYFNHMRQTAIRSIWKGYCRYPSSQQHKNEEWTLDELTSVLCFDDEDQTIKFCEEQDLEFAENANGDLYLNWGSRPVDSVAFQPSSDHSFSETYVESKRAGRNLVAIVLGLNIRESATLGMIDSSFLSQRAPTVAVPELQITADNDDSLFVSDDDNEISTSKFRSNEEATHAMDMVDKSTAGPGYGQVMGDSSQPAANIATQPAHTPAFSFPPASSESQPAGAPNPFASLFSANTSKNTSTAPTTPSLNPFAKAFSPFTSINPAQANQQTATPLVKTAGDQPSNTFSSPSIFAKPSQNHTVSTDPPAPIFSFSNPSLPATSQASPFSLSSNLSQPPAISTTSPFSVPQTSVNAKSDSPAGLTAGQPFSSIFNIAKSSPGPEASPSIFSGSGQGSSLGQSIPKVPKIEVSNPAETPVVEPPKLFSSFTPKTDEAPSIFSTTQEPPQQLDSIVESPTSGFTFSTSQEKPTTNSTAFPTNEVTSASHIAPSTAPSFGIETQVQQVPPSLQDSDIPETVPAVRSPPVVQLEMDSNEAIDSISEGSHDTERQVAWITALKEAADRRRETTSTPTSRKRVLEEQEPVLIENNMKVPKVSKAKEPRPRKSMALSSIKPLPKLPILEVVESMTARKPVEQKPEAPKPNQVDEDELLLSAARIAAESLRTGPKLLDGWSSPYEPWRSSFSPGSSVASSAAFSRSQSPQLSQVNGYDVALAPDTDLGLGRTMSRTEQRIRMTGGKGLAYKPLSFASEKQWKTPAKK